MASDRIQRRVERLLDQIEQEADQRNWQLVLELAREALGFAPDNTDAKAFLGVAEERLGSTSVVESPAVPGSDEPMPATTPTPKHPTTFANGRYQVNRRLWEDCGQKRPFCFGFKFNTYKQSSYSCRL